MLLLCGMKEEVEMLSSLTWQQSCINMIEKGCQMAKFLDLTGKKYNYLTGIQFIGKRGKKSLWIFKCDCGNIIQTTTNNVTSGNKKCCGCQRGLSEKDYYEKAKKRLMENIKYKGDCWEWQGFVQNNNYGKIGFRWKGKHGLYLVHRVSYYLFKGIPDDKMLICHSCDNRKCVNPNHLWIGTHSDNSRDMYKKERYPVRKGVKVHAAKITDNDVKQIRKMEKNGVKAKILAEKFGINVRSIYSIINNKTWKHVK